MIIEWVSDCTFCKIVAGRLPSYRVLQDEHTLAFLNIRPASLGHTLVVPRVHARDVWEISEVSHSKVADMVHRVAGAMLETCGSAGKVHPFPADPQVSSIAPLSCRAAQDRDLSHTHPNPCVVNARTVGPCPGRLQRRNDPDGRQQGTGRPMEA
ncbi:HIT domain-containing protein [Nonomuraea sp. 10N515B]|uniref:HIT domain-containing protein n=1 Tax=Nonomuraea sp. 10N515B TaxID=3457422 RepID=UPI003FCDC55E